MKKLTYRNRNQLLNCHEKIIYKYLFATLKTIDKKLSQEIRNDIICEVLNTIYMAPNTIQKMIKVNQGEKDGYSQP